MNALPLLGSIPLVFLLFAAVAVAPGAVVLRGLRLPAGMRLSAVVGCSLLLAFLAWWLLWLCGVPSMLRQGVGEVNGQIHQPVAGPPEPVGGVIESQ